MQQRRDIQGLRAFAVLAVLLYHFGIRGFEGGFAGVDIFFVISGFLMTGLIVGGMEQNRFSLPRFYLARARRIVPALAVLCISLLGFGWFWLSPADYAMLGKHSANAIAFISNFTFKDEEGYFDAVSETKWLLHTWSLAAEWQFYIIYPLLLMALRRLGGLHRLPWLLWGLGLASFAASICITPADSAFAFYLLPTRAWEMLAGALVYYHSPRLSLRPLHQFGLESVGLSFMLVAVFAFHPEMLWPGYAALLPVAGAALVLLANRQHAPLTTNRIAVRMGDGSYSLYLWHWPMVVALNIFAVQHHAGWLATAIAAAFALAFISYRWVETPTRRLLKSHPWRMAAILISVMGAIALAGGFVSHTKGVPQRVPHTVRAIEHAATDIFKSYQGRCGFNRKTQELVPCIAGDANNIRWVLWGDSHAGALTEAVLKAQGGGVAAFTHQCATIFESEMRAKNRNNHCATFNRKVWEYIQTLPPDVGVIIVNRYSAHVKGANERVNKRWGLTYTDHAETREPAEQLYHDRMLKTLCTVAQKRRTATIAPIPEMREDVPRLMARKTMLGLPTPDITLPRTEYDTRHDIVLETLRDAARQCGTILLDPTLHLCDRNVCYGAKNGQPLYFDDDHLGRAGNALLIPLFKTLKP